jgi:hypothetical protein
VKLRRRKIIVEIVLQWFDDLDDLAYSMLSTWERRRLLCLQLGFAAALILSCLEVSGPWTLWVVTLLSAAVGSVLVWALDLLAVGFFSVLQESILTSSQPNA